MASLISSRSVCMCLVLMIVINWIAFMKFCWQQDEQGSDMSEGNSIAKQPVKFSAWLVLLVMTAPNNHDRRAVIRETWWTSFPKTARLLFVVGSKNSGVLLNKESQQFGDLLILEELEDSYSKLTEKLLLSISHISASYNFTFILKCDDDSYVDGSRLVKLLLAAPTSRLYMGYFTGAAHVKKTGQWAEPNYHLCDRYMPYARGGGYIISSDLALYIANNKHLLQIFNSEDVSLGTWLSALNIQRIHDVRFDTESVSRGCLNHHVISHKQSIEDMKAKYSSLVTTGNLCSSEQRLRPEYQYNWNVHPSLCCKTN